MPLNIFWVCVNPGWSESKPITQISFKLNSIVRVQSIVSSEWRANSSSWFQWLTFPNSLAVARNLRTFHHICWLWIVWLTSLETMEYSHWSNDSVTGVVPRQQMLLWALWNLSCICQICHLHIITNHCCWRRNDKSLLLLTGAEMGKWFIGRTYLQYLFQRKRIWKRNIFKEKMYLITSSKQWFTTVTTMEWFSLSNSTRRIGQNSHQVACHGKADFCGNWTVLQMIIYWENILNVFN